MKLLGNIDKFSLVCARFPQDKQRRPSKAFFNSIRDSILFLILNKWLHMNVKHYLVVAVKNYVCDYYSTYAIAKLHTSHTYVRLLANFKFDELLLKIYVILIVEVQIRWQQ